MLNKDQFSKLILAVFITAQLCIPAVFCQVESSGSSTPAATSSSLELDFSSTDKTMSASKISTPVNIQVGQNSVQVTSSSVLTPGEYAAAMQVLHTGQQSVILGDLGNAIGGQVNLTKVHSPISTLVIPQGVTAVNNFGLTNGALSISGNLTNAGTLYAVSTVSQITNANIFASSVTNLQSGLMTSVLPQAGLAGIVGAVSNLNLNLNVANMLSNLGSITSSAALNIATTNINNQGSIAAQNLNIVAANSLVNAGTLSAINNITAQAASMANTGQILSQIGNVNLATSNLINSALISAQQGRVDISSLLGDTLNINNTLGTISALNTVSFMTQPAYTDSLNLNFGSSINLVGGTVTAPEISLTAPTGSVDLNVDRLNGAVSTVAAQAHVTTAGGTLVLGSTCLSGDPTYYNTGGDVVIATPLSFSGQHLAIVSSGNITTAAGAGAIDTSSSSATGGNILMVAGANFTTTGTASGSNDTTSTLVLSGASTGGGIIDLNSGTAITSLTSRSTVANGTAGNITLVAYVGTSSGTGGTITLPNAVTVQTGGSGTGSNGNVLMIAGATSGTSLSVGSINTSGGSGVQTGRVSLYAATPSLSNGSLLVNNGNIIGGSIAAGTAQAGTINAAAITTGGNQLTVSTTGGISISGAINTSPTSGAGGSVALTGTTSVSTGAITTSAVTAGAGGDINIQSSGNITVGNLIASAGTTTSRVGAITIDSAGVLSMSGITGAGQDGYLTVRGLTSLTAGAIAYAGLLTGISNGTIQITSINTQPAGTYYGSQVYLYSANGGINITGAAGINASSTSTTNWAGGTVRLAAPNGSITVTGPVQTNSSAVNTFNPGNEANPGGIIMAAGTTLNVGNLTNSNPNFNWINLVSGGNMQVGTITSSSATVRSNSLVLIAGSNGTGSLTTGDINNSGSHSGDVFITAPGSITLGNITNNNTGGGNPGSFHIVAGSPGTASTLTITSLTAQNSGTNIGHMVGLYNLNGAINVGAINTIGSGTGNGAGISVVASGAISLASIDTSSPGGIVAGSVFISSGATSGTAISTAGGIKSTGLVGGNIFFVYKSGATTTPGTINNNGNTFFNTAALPASYTANLTGSASTTITINTTVSGYAPGGFSSINTTGTITVNMIAGIGLENPIISLSGGMTLGQLTLNATDATTFQGIPVFLSAGNISIGNVTNGTVNSIGSSMMFTSAGSITLTQSWNHPFLAMVAGQGLNIPNGVSTTGFIDFFGGLGATQLGSPNNQTNNAINNPGNGSIFMTAGSINDYETRFNMNSAGTPGWIWLESTAGSINLYNEYATSLGANHYNSNINTGSTTGGPGWIYLNGATGLNVLRDNTITGGSSTTQTINATGSSSNPAVILGQFLSPFGSINLSDSSSLTSAGNKVYFSSATGVTTPISVSAAIVNFSTSLSGPITLTGTTAATTSSSISVYGTQTVSGSITTPSLSIYTQSGSVGTSGSNLTTTATTLSSLTSTTGGDIYVISSGALTVAAITFGGTLSLVGSGITISGAINADSVSLRTTGAGGIAIAQTITAGTSITLTSASTGAITETAGRFLIAPAVSLTAGTGSIGTSLTPIAVSTLSLSASTAGTNVYMTQAANTAAHISGSVTLGPSSSAGTLFNFVSNGSINQHSGSTITATTVNLTSTTGSIGISTNPIAIAATNIVANATTANQNVYITDSGGVSVSAASQAGSAGGWGIFSLTTSSGNLTNSAAGTVTGGVVQLTSAGTLSLAGTITGNTSVSLQATSIMNGNFATVTTPILNLTATTGSIGIAATPVTVSATNVSANATALNQNVYVTDSVAGNILSASQAGSSGGWGAFSFRTAAGNLTSSAGATVTGGVVTLTSSAAAINLGATVTGNTSVTLQANNNITISNAADITAGTGALALTATSGSIQTTGGLLSSAGGNVTFTAGAGGTLTSAGNNLRVSAGNSINLTALAGLAINTTGAGAGGSVQLTAGTSVANGSINGTGVAINTSGTGTSAGGGVSLVANNGATSLITIGNITANGAGATVGGANATNGAVSGITVTSGSTITVGSISGQNATAGSVVAGATVSLSGNSAATITAGVITVNGGLTSGNGGSISIVNNGSGGITINGGSSLSAAAVNGTGGSITLDATAGATDGVINVTGPLTMSVTPSSSGAGGTITMSGSQLTVAGGALTLNAQGAGTGNGGSISITTTGATGDITVGAAAGNVIVSVTGGSGGSVAGNGGSLTLSAGRTLTVNSASLTAGPLGTNGNGATLNLTSGTAAAGNMPITGSLSANGVGTGNGGSITLISNSATAFTLGNGVLANGVNGLSANKGSGGSNDGNITMRNNGGDVTVSLPLAANNITLQTGAAGNGNVNIYSNVTGTTAVNITAGGAGNVLVYAAAPVVASTGVNAPGQLVFNAAGTTAYSVDAANGRLLIIDPATNAVTGTINLGGSPEYVAVDSANNRAYVTKTGSNVVTVVNLSGNTVLGTVTLSARANGVAVSPSGTKIFVATGEDKVTVISTADFNTYTPGAPIVVDVNATGVGTQNLTIDATGAYLYITNQTSQRVSIMNVATNAIVAGTGGTSGAILVGSRPLGMAANGGFIYVTNYLSHDVYTINTATQAVTSQNGVTGINVGATSTPVAIAVSANGTFAYTANQTTNTVSVINLATYQTVDTIALASAPTSITMSPDGSFAYVSSAAGNSLTRITMPPLVTGGTVNLTSGTGNIGTVAAPVRVAATTLTVNSGGNAYVEQTGNVSIGASTVTGLFQLAGSGTITNTALITAGNLSWITNNKDITLGANLTVTGAANIYAVGSGNIYRTAGMLTAGSVNLFSSYGNIGTLANPITTTTPILRANTSGTGNVFLNNTGNVSLMDSTAGGSFTLTNSVGTTINIAGRVVVPSTAGHDITIQTTGNNAANRINVQAKVVAGGTVTLTATGGTVSYASATGISTQLAATVPGVTNATAVALDSTGTFAYVTDSVNWPPTTGYVRVVSTATNTVVATITVGANPEGVAITPDGKYLFVTNRFSDNVSVIDLQAGGTFRQVVATISLPAGSEPWGISFNPTGGSNQAYVVNTGSSTISVVNWQTRAVTGTISGLPVGVFASYPKGVAYNPAGTRAYIADQFNRAVTVIDTGTNAIVTNISVGDGPFGIATTTVGGTPFAYVTNVSDNTVSVINLNTNTVTATINVGNNPIGVSLMPAGTFAYVVNQGSDSVSVINTTSNTVVATVPVGSLPMGMGNFVGNVGGNVRAYIANKGGTVSVLDPSPALVDPYLVVLNAANVATAADPIGILTEHLQINATGDVYAKISGSTIIDASTIGGTLNLQADGNIITGGDIVAGSVALQTPLSLLVGNITSTGGNISLNGNSVDVSNLATVTANNGSVFVQQAGGGLSVTNATLNYTGGLLQSFMNMASVPTASATVANSTAALQTGALPMSFSGSAQLWAGGGFPIMSAAAVSALDQLGSAAARVNNNANTTADSVVGGTVFLGAAPAPEQPERRSGVAKNNNKPLTGMIEQVFDISLSGAPTSNVSGHGLRSTAVRADQSTMAAIVKDLGADFVVGDNTVRLHGGDVVISSLKSITVLAGKHTLRLDKGAVVLVRVRGDHVAVANLFDGKYGNVSLLVNNNRSLNIGLGEEIMLGTSSEDVSAAINDGVARRSIRLVDVKDTSLASSQFSYLSVMQKSPLLQSLHLDGDASSRSISARIEKAAVCLMQVTAARGPYKTGPAQ